ncbi:MAG: polyphosphate:AMP phosphotransferase [Gemmataceae bacterium]
MFEKAELGNRVDKDTYAQELPALRAQLLAAQRQLAEANFSVLILVSGVPGGGKSETVDRLLEWMDPRGIQTHAMSEWTDEERQRPPMWRYWRRLPPNGHMGIFFGGWEHELLVRGAFGKLEQLEIERRLDRYLSFERMLVQENVVLVKFWLHLSRRELKKRLKKLEKDPAQRWRVTRKDWKLFRRYDTFRSHAEELLRRTSTGAAPWTIVESVDRRFRNLTVGRTLLQAIQQRLEQVHNAPPRPAPQPIELIPDARNLINTLDLTQTVTEEEYREASRKIAARIGPLTRALAGKQRSLLLVFEGADAAGKGGAIRRLTQAMDARDYQVIPFAAPTDEERAHPYLWRFWRHLPRLGKVTIYDRSWYGRVLVERVEGFARPEEWQRAYSEINDFEYELEEHGILVRKFWLAISAEEQLRRFEAREETPYKQYKITAEDWRNRARWNSYEAAACDMVARTSTEKAPWILVEAENKLYARLKVLQTVEQTLEEALSRR